jgi:hypothetical protein
MAIVIRPGIVVEAGVTVGSASGASGNFGAGTVYIERLS